MVDNIDINCGYEKERAEIEGKTWRENLLFGKISIVLREKGSMSYIAAIREQKEENEQKTNKRYDFPCERVITKFWIGFTIDVNMWMCIPKFHVTVNIHSKLQSKENKAYEWCHFWIMFSMTSISPSIVEICKSLLIHTKLH